MLNPTNPAEQAAVDAAAALLGKAEAPKEAPPAGVQEPTEPPKPQEKGPSLAELIRESREARTRAQAEETSAKTLREENEALKAKLTRYSKSDLVADPVGFAEDHELTPEEVATVGQAFLYSLVPEKADAKTRTELLEAREARRKKLAEKAEIETQERAKAAAEEAQRQESMKVYSDYVAAVTAKAQTVSEGTYPDSEAWFGQDHEGYAQSLIATANNLAEGARVRGESADLSFENVAKVLEAAIAERYDRRKARQAPAAGTQISGATKVAGTTQSAVEPMTTKGLTGGGSPRPPAKTDEERLARASEVLFRK